MTREEILAMKPGPEMDETIHRIIFGEDPEEGYNHYSRSMSDAWEVVEKMTSTFDLRFGIDNSSVNGKWNAGFSKVSYWGNAAPTASEAICKAALLAVLDR